MEAEQRRAEAGSRVDQRGSAQRQTTRGTRLNRNLRNTLLLSAAVVAALAAFFQIVYRPWQLNWGSNRQEIERPMPGDEIVSAPTFIATRAVTIRSRPEEIWPWIVQIGYRRAGFYSYDRLDNDSIPSAEVILPEFQNLAIGDAIPLSKTATLLATGGRRGSSLHFVREWVSFPLSPPGCFYAGLRGGLIKVLQGTRAIRSSVVSACSIGTR